MSIYNEKIEDPVRTQRSYLMFESGMRAKDTKRSYKIYLEHFKKFAKVNDYDSLISMNDNDEKYRLRDELEKKQNKIDELQSSKERILLMESQLSEIQEHIKNLKA